MTLPVFQSELAGELFKNPYNFGFLNLAETAKERELEAAILANIIDPLVESEKNIWMLGFEFLLEGFKKAGAKAFDLRYNFEVKFEKYRYLIVQQRTSNIDERSYSQIHTQEELKVIADKFVEMIVDDITRRLEYISKSNQAKNQ